MRHIHDAKGTSSFFLVAVSTVATATALSACGGVEDVERTDTVGLAVVNGRLATESEILSTVAVMYGSHQGCTGTLIANDVVVTAAHCLRDNPDDPNSPDIAPSLVTVLAGFLDVSAAPADAHHAVERVKSHENYPAGVAEGTTGLGQDDDIGIIVLADPVTEIEPIAVLPVDQLEGALTLGKQLTVTGYGVTTLAPNADSGVLYTGEAPYIERSDFEILAGGGGTGDVCYGDSGGPLYVQHDEVMYLVGATSHGPNDSFLECGDRGIFTTVSAYADWIESARVAPPPPPEPEPEPEPTPPPSDGDNETEEPSASPASPIRFRQNPGGCSTGGDSTPTPSLLWATALGVIALRRRTGSARRGCARFVSSSACLSCGRCTSSPDRRAQITVEIGS